MQARTTTLSQALFPSASLVRHVALVVGFVALTALCARIRIFLPWTPVPITGQTFAVLLSGAVLGSRLGAVSQGTYFALGLVGAPVFQGGNAGWDYVTGATGGYLIGFVIAAYLVGLLAERGWDRRHVAAAMLLGNVAIYVPGLLWLGAVANVAWERVLPAGLYPFVLGDLLKLTLAAVVLPSAWVFLRPGPRT